jgi:phage terminase large subunit GpA-like protein
VLATWDAANAALARAREEAGRRLLAPPPKLSLSEWADRYRVISPEFAPEPGKWHTDRAPYLRAMMDAISDPSNETVVFFTAAQIGKTECLLNAIGYYIDQDPSPILVVYPTIGDAEKWSTGRLAPMVRDTPRLADRVKDPRSRDSGNTILRKNFSGGQVLMVGANAPSGLAGWPIRIVLADEIDRYARSAGTEGDPIALAKKRTLNFWNRKIVLATTPTIKGFSRGEKAYAESDQREYHVPCPHCRQTQLLTWGSLIWEQGKPETVHAVCEHCGAVIEETDKAWMLEPANGAEWVPKNPGHRTPGFWINALYSPWARWPKLVQEWLEAQGFREELQVFTNTVLGELWEETGDQVPLHLLFDRLEPYGPTPNPTVRPDSAPVPSGACVLTCGVDVQGDRLEVRVWAWGPREESWLVEREIIPGDPGDAGARGPWGPLDAFLRRSYEHKDGARLALSSTFIDSGGHHTKEVYAFCRERLARKIFACKGSSMEGHPLLSRPTRSNSGRAILFMVGTSTAKDSFASQLRITAHGAGFVHLPDWADREELEQLTSEKKHTRYSKGRPYRLWVPTRDANHALDCRVYASAAFAALGPDMIRQLPQLLERVRAAGAKRKAAPPGASVPAKPPVPPGIRRIMARAKRRQDWIKGTD